MRRAVFVAALALLSGAAQAHRPPATGTPEAAGISIPSLTHGQMAVIDRNLSAIRDMAHRQNASDLTLWRLEDYLNLQSFACLWGLAPGAIADETSPFNECAHAYLAAARSVLLRTREVAGFDRVAVEALVAKVEREMVENGAALTLCRYSDEPFSTDEIVWPRWSEIPRHPPSLAAFSLALLAVSVLGWGFWPRRPAPVQPARIAE